MPLENSMLIAAAGMKAQGARLRVIAENVANANSTAQQPLPPENRNVPQYLRS
jgi:flagellar basal-body rod protein FlgC